MPDTVAARRLEARTLFGLIVATILTVVGIGGLINGLVIANDWMELLRWLPESAHVTRVELLEHPTELGRSYELMATFEVSWNGTLHQSQRVAVRRWHTFDRSLSEALFEQLQSARTKDEPVACRLNPEHPDESVLFADFPIGPCGNALLVGLSLGLAGVWLGQRVWFGQRRRWQVAALTERLSMQPWCWDPDRFEGRCPVVRRWPLIVGLATIWNLPTIGLVLLIAQGIATQSATYWWLAPPAVVVGASLAAIALHALWQWQRYGEPRLEVRPWPLMLGDPLECTWRVTEERSWPKSLSVWLEVPPELAQADTVNAATLKPQSIQLDNGRATWTCGSPWPVVTNTEGFDVENYQRSNWQLHIVDPQRLFGLHLVYDVAVFYCPSDTDAADPVRVDPESLSQKP